ncbi:MAG TPA: SAM-dependent methyltransferase [Casimicrobiaceae bacterium]|nr:SAM-dependent methyltransferase [Casimicrobiaceae bacterium]
MDGGRVDLVGAGPGAADLLTMHATRLLAASDIVFHDALIDEDVLALAPRAEKVAVGKRCGAHSTSQRFIDRRLVSMRPRRSGPSRRRDVGDRAASGRGAGGRGLAREIGHRFDPERPGPRDRGQTPL